MRLIDADALKGVFIELKKDRDIGYGDMARMVTVNIDYVVKMIDESPSADVIERKRGKWIAMGGGDWKCSCCNYTVSPWNNTQFCPNCGADMREEGE